MTVGLPDGAPRDLTRLDDRYRQRDHVGKGDRPPLNAPRPDTIILIESILAGQQQPEAVDNSLRESVERMAVKPRRQFDAAPFPNPRLQVLARVYLE
jgi:hypothetical protein